MIKYQQDTLWELQVTLDPDNEKGSVCKNDTLQPDPKHTMPCNLQCDLRGWGSLAPLTTWYVQIRAMQISELLKYKMSRQ